MLIKSADDKQPDIDALTTLLARPDLDSSTKRRIEQEIRTIRAGVTGERDAAYELDFRYRDSSKRVLIHDLRIEVDRRVAQIDHLLIARSLEVWVFESKHFAEGVGVNEQGEWVTFWKGRARGIPSPVEQNRKHIVVLNDAFEKGLVRLPKRLGLTIRPRMYSFIIVSSGARISRPKSRAAAARVDGLDTVVKADQLATVLDKQRDQMSALDGFGVLARAISTEALEDFAKQLVALHKPSRTDWAARFGIVQVPPASPAVQLPTVPDGNSEAGQPCASCGSIVSPKVAAYCEANAKRFAGRILCWSCQRHGSRPAAPA